MQKLVIDYKAGRIV